MTQATGPRMYNVREVSQLTGGLHPNTIRAEINCGRLRAVRVGNGWKVPADWLQEWIDRLKAERVARPTRGG